KYEVEGSEARAFLDQIVANRIPNKIGGLCLAHALNPSGSVRSEFTITKLSDGKLGERFLVIGPGAAHDYDWDFLMKHAPLDGTVVLRDCTTSLGTFVVAGPNARKTLAPISDGDLSNAAFPWLHARMLPIGFCQNVLALRVNFVGSLGWELHHPIEYQAHLYDCIMQAGEAYGIKPVGMRAMDSMRLEKSYRLWGTDLNAECSALEAGLDRFIAFNKGDFPGRAALLKQKEQGITKRFCTIEIDADDADSFGNEPIFIDGEVRGRATAGGYGHWVQKSLMLGYVASEYATAGQACEVRILDQLRPARIIAESPYDPDNLALRA
ncbi:MAG: aminomethyltransferase family protein, partial [Pseudomonadota bacterium]